MFKKGCAFDDLLAVSRYNRHQWDIPACWLDDRYLKVCPILHTIMDHDLMKNLIDHIRWHNYSWRSPLLPQMLHLPHVPKNLPQDINANRYLDWLRLYLLHLFSIHTFIGRLRSP